MWVWGGGGARRGGAPGSRCGLCVRWGRECDGATSAEGMRARRARDNTKASADAGATREVRGCVGGRVRTVHNGGSQQRAPRRSLRAGTAADSKAVQVGPYREHSAHRDAGGTLQSNCNRVKGDAGKVFHVLYSAVVRRGGMCDRAGVCVAIWCRCWRYVGRDVKIRRDNSQLHVRSPPPRRGVNTHRTY